MKFSHAASLKSFGDIGHDRDGGSLDLIGQAKVSGKGLLLCDFVDAFREQASFLPRDQIFESFYRAHDPSSIALRTQNSALYLTSLNVTKKTSEVWVTASLLWRKRRPRSGIEPKNGTFVIILSRRDCLMPAK